MSTVSQPQTSEEQVFSGLHLNPTLLGAFRRLINAKVGLRIDDERIASFASCIADRAALLAVADLEGYYRRLSSSSGAAELQELLDLFTVGETYFFRVPAFFSYFQQQVLPDIVERRQRAGQHSLAIWSAACASGEEPYSIAISLLTAEVFTAGWEVELLATDVSRVALQRAKEGRYSPWAFRAVAVDDEAVARYFRPDGDRFSISSAVRERVRFEPLNLKDEAWPVPPHGAWDVIFLRNVLMYFTSKAVTEVLDRAHRYLHPDGYLFIGECESVVGLTDKFEMVEHAGVFAYRPLRPQRHRPAPSPATPGSPTTLELRSPPLGAATAIRGGGADAKTGAGSLRHRTPSAGLPTAVQPPPSDHDARPLTARERGQRLLALALDDFAHERNDRALSTLQRVVELDPEQTEARLTIANIHASNGRYEPAHQECLAVQQIDPLCAVSYLLEGVICFEQQRLELAEAQLRRALYLDQELPLGWYFCGKLKETQGDTSAALRHYERALRTTRQSDRVALQLGFSSEKLIRVLEMRCAALGGR